jgi:hypothetical protein
MRKLLAFATLVVVVGLVLIQFGLPVVFREVPVGVGSMRTGSR